LNRIAISVGKCVSSQQVALFRQNHHAKLKRRSKATKQLPPLPSILNPAFVYGKKSGVKIPIESILKIE